MKRACSLPFVLFLIGFLLLHTAETTSAVSHALQLAAVTVIPALFPFCVLSNFLLLSGMTDGWKYAVRFISTKLFGLEEEAGLPWILGVFCGFPIGAIVTAKQYANGAISKDGAERILALSNHASPSFVIAVAGGTVLQSYRAGFLLWAVQLLASLLTGFFLRPAKPPVTSVESEASSLRPLPAFVEAVKTAALTMCQLTGFIVCFSVLLCLITPLLSSAYSIALISGLLELTNGIASLSSLPRPACFLLLSVMLGFSGFCVHAQVLSFTIPLGLSVRPYLIGKVLHAVLAGLLSILFLPLLPDAVIPAFGFCMPFPELPAILIPLFFFFLWKFGLGFGIISKTRNQRRRHGCYSETKNTAIV